MATGRVENRNEVFLNGYFFPVRNGVTRQVANQFAPKTVIGEFSEASDPLLSAINWQDFTGGQGQLIFNPRGDGPRRYWTGEMKTHFPGHAFPVGGLVSIGGQAFNSSTERPLFYRNYEGEFYTVLQDSASSYALKKFSLDSGVSFTFDGPPTDMETGYLNGLNTLVVPTSGSHTFWTRSDTNDSTWFSDSSENIRHVQFWREMLWGVNESGELFFTPSLGDTSVTWTRVAQANVTSSRTVQNLAIGPDATGEDALYLVRNDGFDKYDNATETFRRALVLPARREVTPGFTYWNGSVFYSQALSVLQWTPTPDGAITSVVGMDLLDGLDAPKAGVINTLDHTLTDLYAQVEPASSSFNGGIYRWNPVAGWSPFALQSSTDLSGGSFKTAVTGEMHITEADAAATNSPYRIAGGWAEVNPGGGLYPAVYAIPANGAALGLSSGFADGFARVTNLVTSWVEADPSQEWVALKAGFNVTPVPIGADAGGLGVTAKLSYGLNMIDSVWTDIGTVDGETDSAGAFDFKLPTPSNPVGVPFKAFRLRTQVQAEVTGDIPGVAYDIHSMGFVFEKRPKLRYLFTFDIDLTFKDKYKGRSAKELREAFDGFLMQQTLGEFTYSDEDPGGGKTYYVRAINPISQENTGQIERDIIRCNVMELA